MGHYVSVVRNKGTWMLLDDDHSEPVTETYVQRCFGSYDGSYHAECAYILVYRARDDSIVRSTSAAALAEHVTDEADEDVNVGALADGMADAIAPPDAIDAVS